MFQLRGHNVKKALSIDNDRLVIPVPPKAHGNIDVYVYFDYKHAPAFHDSSRPTHKKYPSGQKLAMKPGATLACWFDSTMWDSSPGFTLLIISVPLYYFQMLPLYHTSLRNQFVLL